MSEKNINFHQEIEQFNLATQEMLKKSDRFRVVLLGAEIDRLLKLLLQAYLVPSRDGRDFLLEGGATFTTRIELGFRVGLLKPEWVDDLRVINAIRDKFAHGRAGLCLDKEPFRELCYTLQFGQQWIDAGDNRGKEGDNSATRFVATAVMLASHICVIGITLKPLDPISKTYPEDLVELIKEEDRKSWGI